MLSKYKTRYLLLAFALFWTPVIVFSKLAGEVLERDHISIDESLLYTVHSYATPTLDRVFHFITTLGSAEVLVPVMLLLTAFLFYKHRRKSAWLLLFGVGGAAAANFILKLLFQRDRPALWDSLILETSYSFPSGHAMASAAFALSIIAITWHTRFRWLAVAAGAVFVFLIGLSRLYFGVHYPTDVIAGWCAATAWVAIVYIVMYGLPRKPQPDKAD